MDSLPGPFLPISSRLFFRQRPGGFLARSAQLPAPGSSRFLGQLSRSESSMHTAGRCQLSGLRARFPAG